ncbi:Snf2 family helicase, partial [Veillonellaceae bacterium M2-4]|nr:Snf2 family helicase [Veillonellaceae bacterium M2-4]
TMAEQSAGMRIGLSGTPLENNLSEFWALMQMILPGLLPSKRDFQNLPVATIRTLVSPFVLRRTKEEVALELPNKSVHNQLASLETDQKVIYLAYLKDIQERLNGDAGSKKNLHLEMLSAITRLRQICCHPALIKEDYQGKSGKFE